MSVKVPQPPHVSEHRNRLPVLGLDGWTILVMIVALLLASPVLFVLGSIFTESQEVWHHLATTVLSRYLINSCWLMVGVGAGVLLIGVSTAWVVTMCQFWGRRVFEWALLLPLAAPAYVLAYTYTEWLEYYGPIQRGLRQLFGWKSIHQYWFPDIRSLPGAILMLILVLYPYVYLLARVAFLEQSVCTLEASRSLGCGPWRSFGIVALPLARPAIMAGLALALMETLNDFGTVEYFGVDTFTTGIYRTWFGLGNRVAAAQLAAVLMLFILGLILLERWSRRQAQYYQSGNFYQHWQAYQLRGVRAIGAGLLCFLPILFGFLLPATLLLDLTLKNAHLTLNQKFWQIANNSLSLALITAGVAVIIGLIMAYGQRLQRNWWMRLSVRLAAMGYAIPGSVIAVGVLIPVGSLDNWIDQWMRSTWGISTGLLFTGTITALVFGYLVRFMAVSFGAVESSLSKIPPSLDEAARSLGHNPTSTLVKVHAPMMWGGLLTGAMLVFVDVMKELPATLVMRPFNFDTLAVQVYRYAADERLPEASGPALAIVVVGILPVILLSWRIARSGRSAVRK